VDERKKLAAAVLAVLVSMVFLFVVPRAYFSGATIVSTSCMIVASYSLGLRPGKRPSARPLFVGVVSAAALYGIFFAGNAGINALHPFGLSSSNESSIYSLISGSGGTPYLSAVVLVFDSVGYESFFRGTLQARAQGRLGFLSAPAVAALDASIHIITGNLLWVATTFVADLAWGITYYSSKSLYAPFTSHLLWDVAIFIFLPIR
jgi:membrane protease YdiL (CAAX protease family)